MCVCVVGEGEAGGGGGDSLKESSAAALTSTLIKTKHIFHKSHKEYTDAGLHFLPVGVVGSCKTPYWFTV